MNSILFSLSLMIAPSALGSDDDTPLGPGGEPGGSPGEWIPIGQPGENDEGSCGEWSWHPNRPGLVSTDRPTAPSPFSFGTLLQRGQATWAVGFEQTGPNAQRALQARCSLKADAFSATGEVDLSTYAERNGFLRWRTENPGTAPLPQRVRIVSRGTVAGNIMLDFGLVLAGETSRIASGGLHAWIDTRGSWIGSRIANKIAQSRTSAEVSPYGVHASSPQQTGLGVGITVGTENGGSAQVQWTAGGTIATITLDERMECVEWDCIVVEPSNLPGHEGQMEWFFEQHAFVFAGAKLLRGYEAAVKARVTMGDFYFERQECPCLDPVTGGGPQQMGASGGGSSGGGGG